MDGAAPSGEGDPVETVGERPTPPPSVPTSPQPTGTAPGETGPIPG